MSYLKLSDLDGAPRFGGKGFLPGIANIVVSKFGSKKSNSTNSKSAKRNGWGGRYSLKNNRRDNRMSRRG